jgi:circadian clock protein KaiC
MVDTWMMVQDIEIDAERSRSLCIMKSRGMAHSTDVHKFIISPKGITLVPIVANKKGLLAEAKRKAKEHDNLSTSKESIEVKESSR